MNKPIHQSSPLPSLFEAAPQSPLPQSWDSFCGNPSWGLSWLLAVQHILVQASLLCVCHLLLLHSLPPGGLSYPPGQLLASSLFSCGLSTAIQTWMGSRLPLVQAPSFEFLIPALVLASQKPYQATWAPGNNSHALSPCVGTGCSTLGSWDESLREVSGAVLMSGLLQGTLGLLGGPGRLFLHFGPLVLAPSLVVVGLSAHKEVALFCSANWGLALLIWDPACCLCVHCELLSLQLTPMSLSSASSRSCLLLTSPHGCGCLTQAGSHRVARLVSLLSIGLGLSPRLAQALTTIPLPVHGAVLGVNQAVILSTGFSYYYFTDIDSGRNVFIVGFAVFMALLLPRWLQDAVLNTGLSPGDVLLCSFLAEPVLLAGLLSFLLENTIPGTRLERGLPSPKEAQAAAKPRKDASGYELPAPFQKLCSLVPRPLRCLCFPAEHAGDEERGPSEPRETAGLLPSAEDPRLGPAVTRAD
uniref:Solute carrier family 23 member 3 n=1 Tax=Vombatus ursinus TaxID=29139 RepID=A0A4X2JYB0_VOMUR